MANNMYFKRSIGLPSATLLLIGSIVGASIFIVPGQLASDAGPAVWLAYLIAGVLALFTALVFAQIGSLLPVAGANYRFASRTVNGSWGFLYILTFGTAIIVLIPITAITIAQYLGVFWAPLNSLPVVIAVIILTAVMNIFGIGAAKLFQNLLVVAFMIVIVVFIVGGFAEPNWDNFTPMFPSGVSPIVSGVLVTYYSFIGVNTVLELSGEIINPRKNIARMVLIGLAVVTVVYVLLSVALVALVRPAELGVDASISYAAGTIFPPWVSGVLALAAVAASWTTLNGALMALPRDLYALSRGKILPRALGKLSRRNSPVNAIIVVSILGIAVSFVSDDLSRFISSSTIFVLAAVIVLSISSLRVKLRLSTEYAEEGFKLRGIWFYFWPVGGIVMSGFFMALGIKSDPLMGLISLAFVAVGMVFYMLRTRSLSKQGVAVDEAIDRAVVEELSADENVSRP